MSTDNDEPPGRRRALSDPEPTPAPTAPEPIPEPPADFVPLPVKSDREIDWSRVPRASERFGKKKPDYFTINGVEAAALFRLIEMLEAAVFHGGTIDREEYEWIRRSPQVAMVARNVDISQAPKLRR